MFDDDRKTTSETGEEWEGHGLGGYLQAVMFGLQNKHIYGGTVPPEVVARRRRKNRAARRARRGNVAALRAQARSNRVANGRRTFRRGQAGDPLGLHDGDAVDPHEPDLASLLIADAAAVMDK